MTETDIRGNGAQTALQDSIDKRSRPSFTRSSRRKHVELFK